MGENILPGDDQVSKKPNLQANLPLLTVVGLFQIDGGEERASVDDDNLRANLRVIEDVLFRCCLDALHVFIICLMLSMCHLNYSR
jgi:hypothetical protein